MALNLSKCVMHKTREFKVVPGFSIKEEGLPLVKVFVDGKEAVKVYDGSTDDNPAFIGFSYTESLTPRTATAGVTLVLDNEGKGSVIHPIMPDQISVYDVTIDEATGEIKRGSRYANSAVTVDTTDPRFITVTAAANKSVEVVYGYQPTINDLMQNSYMRLLIPFMSSTEMTGSIGVIMDGEVYTDKVDLSADFTAADIKFAISADGLLTCYTGDAAPKNSVAVNNMELIEYPTAANPCVGVRITR